MLKLMKYEFRKTMFSKAILLIITAVVELLYLVGVFLKHANLLAIGTVGLVMCAIIGIFYIGIESLLVFHNDLNTKQSYMLFLTPRNSYQILGAKVLENAICIFLAGIFFSALAALDITVGVLYIGGVKEFMNLIHDISVSFQVEVNITAMQAILTFFMILAGWLEMIVTGDLAIVLSSTVLAGKRLSGLVSFLLYLLIGWGLGWIRSKAPAPGGYELQISIYTGITLVFVVLLYVVTGWIMEKKLSV